MRISMVLVGLVAFSAVACGGSSDDGGGKGSTTVNTSIPDSTKASDLTEPQIAELCTAAGKAASSAVSEADMKAATCGFLAFTQATFTNMPNKCQDFYNECLKAPQESDGNAGPQAGPDDQCIKPSSACTATVGEIEKCLNDGVAQSKAALAKFPSCDDVGKEPSESDADPEETVASCEVIEQKCPELITITAQPDLPFDVEDGAADAPQAPGSNG